MAAARMRKWYAVLRVSPLTALVVAVFAGEVRFVLVPVQLALSHRCSRKLSTLVVEVGAVQDRLMLEWAGDPAAAAKLATCGSFSLAVLPCTVEDQAESSKPEFGAATARMRKWYGVLRVSPEVTVCDVAEAAGVPMSVGVPVQPASPHRCSRKLL